MSETTDEKIRVLIVDDHRVFGEALALALAGEAGIEVVGGPVLNGGEAAESAIERDVDVVLMDLNLPDRDGIEATRDIKQARPGTKVVILSADPPEHRLVEAAEAGASGYVTKTIAVSQVADSVRRAAAGEILIPGDVLARVLARMAQERSRKARADQVAALLTPREVEVLGLLAEGLSNRRIARRLVVSPRTADTHVHNLLTKLGAHSKLEAVVMGIRWGIVDVLGGP